MTYLITETLNGLPAALWSNDAIKTQFLGVPRSERWR